MVASSFIIPPWADPAVWALLVVSILVEVAVARTVLRRMGVDPKGFTTALSDRSVSQSAEGGSEALVAGSEEFWLTDPTGKKTLSGGRIQPSRR